MGQVHIEVEPEEVGFDAARLRRIDRHFDRYVADGRLPGWLILVARHGKVAHLATRGMRDIEAEAPVETDTLFRIYSMTKPITSVAAMMLYEQGAIELTDPVSEYIPSFADMRVYTGGPQHKVETRPATEPMRIWHLLTHTSGLTYGFQRVHPVDGIHRFRGFDVGIPTTLDLAECCAEWAQIPLLFDPGQAWNYSVATDVLGRVVEVVSGQYLDEFFREQILHPLGMYDTSFWAAEENADRVAALYLADKTGKVGHKAEANATKQRTMLSGGGGLLSSAADYHRFLRMLLGRGQLDGIRLLGSRTVDFMTRNHLPGGANLDTYAIGTLSEESNAGRGFGLGFAVVNDPIAGKVLTGSGEYSWGGMASTEFWVDPASELSVLFLTQLMPAGTHPIRSQLRQLVYQALVD